MKRLPPYSQELVNWVKQPTVESDSFNDFPLHMKAKIVRFDKDGVTET